MRLGGSMGLVSGESTVSDWRQQRYGVISGSYSSCSKVWCFELKKEIQYKNMQVTFHHIIYSQVHVSSYIYCYSKSPCRIMRITTVSQNTL